MAIKIITIIFVLCNCINLISSAAKCDRVPEGTAASKSQPDGRFRLRITNEPQYYIPGETYNITLEGVSRISQPLTQKFSAFFITAERVYDENSQWEGNGYDDIGRFTILSPATSKISEKCPNLVVNTNSVSKSEISVQWTAPLTSGKGCLVFRSTVIEHRDVWFMDDGALSKTLCEDEADASDIEPFIINECKACDEAKYELTFEGLWSRQRHPKDFPDDGWLTKFSDVIGASHMNGDTFWKYGNASTLGLRDVAEHGATQRLEEELKQKGENVRTIIKARGISYPNVNGKTFAVFRVDAQHHLISLVSKIYPSPDWFVGVSDMELCTPHGQWIEYKEINLYPYDAGTDSGPTYTSPDQPTFPQEAIRRLKPNNPNDPRSPFYDHENKEMKPLAKLYITRQRLYEKACEHEENSENIDSRNGDGEEEVDNNGNVCATTEWEAFSECNNPCGDGVKTRRRYFVNSAQAYRSGCQEKLADTRDCIGKKCPTTNRGANRVSDRNDNRDREVVREDINNQQRGGAGSDENTNDNNKNNDDDDDDDEEGVPNTDRNCELTEWSDEGCTCENGQKREHRLFKKEKYKKGCIKKYPNVKLEKYVNCGMSDCTENDQVESSTRKACYLSKWSRYSKCSASCFGQKIRVRRPDLRHQLTEDDLKRIAQIYSKLQSKTETIDDIIGLNITSVANQDHPCAGQKLVEAERCGDDDENCEEELVCSQPPIRGLCDKEPENRYYYNKNNNDCGLYVYTGCPGNKNDFEDYNKCREICMNVGQGESSEALPQSRDLVSKQRREKIDCEVSEWKNSPCNATCGESYKWKYRDVVRRPQNGGRACPIKLRQLERCHVDECTTMPSYTNYNNRNYPASRYTTTPSTPQSIRCEYSEWSAWSPCSKSCGASAIKIRTRTVLNYQNSHLCSERLEEKACEVMPCLVGNYHNYRNHHPYY